MGPTHRMRNARSRCLISCLAAHASNIHCCHRTEKQSGSRGDPAYAGVSNTGLAASQSGTVLVRALLVERDLECSVCIEEIDEGIGLDIPLVAGASASGV